MDAMEASIGSTSPRGATLAWGLGGEYTTYGLTLADWFSLVRIPLGAVFLFVAHRLPLAIAVLVLAGISDVLDGWAARRHGDVDRPHRGDWLDPFCDKVFVACMLAGIYVVHRPSLALLALVVTRELLQVASLVVYKVSPTLRKGLHYNYRAHPIGKATTVTQFATALALLFDHPLGTPLALAAGALGLASVAIYLNRARLLAREEAHAGAAAPGPPAPARTTAGGSATPPAPPAR
jgi:cardiolipin synthase (CMP-forming)